MNISPVDRLVTLSDARCADLRRRFTEQGFVPAAIDAAERIAPKLFDAQRLPLVRWTLARQATPGGDLARLFAYGEPLPRERADDLLGADLVTDLLGAGVLHHGGVPSDVSQRAVVSGFLLLPFDGLWLMGDDMARTGDTVMGPGPTTGEIAQAVPGVFTGSILDVGCGAGTLCLLAAHRGATRAVGVDVNPRAVEVATFNARLNGLRAEFRVGDLLAPVRGERFDLIVAQPPFVTKPADVETTTYLHGGTQGDELSLRLLGEVPDALTPTGRAVVLFDTPLRTDSPLHLRVRAALAGAAVDVLALAAPGHSADHQAMAYAAVQAADFGEVYAETAVRYRRHLDALDIREVTHALVVLAARPGVSGGRYTVTLPVNTLSGIDASVLDVALGSLELATASDGVLRAARVAASPRARFIEERATLDRSVAPTYRVRFDRGALTADQELSEASMVLLEALDQAPSVDAAVALYAEACDAPPEELRGQTLDFVRKWLARGLLVPA